MTPPRARFALAPIVLVSLVLAVAGCSSTDQKADIPDPPTDVSAIASNVAAEVSFLAPIDDGGSDITSYAAACSSPDAPGTGAQSTKDGPITVPGLKGGTSY